MIEDQIRMLLLDIVSSRGSHQAAADELGLSRAYITQLINHPERGRLPESLNRIIDVAGYEIQLVKRT